MKQHYPRYVVGAPGKPAIRVEDAATHEKFHPEDYAKLQDEITADPTGGRADYNPNASAPEERERAAIIAETFPNVGEAGLKIADAIRGKVGDAPVIVITEGPPVSVVEEGYPKVLRNPTFREKPNDKYTELRDGTYMRPDVTVKTKAEEDTAVAEGYTVVVPDIQMKPLTPGEKK